MYVCMFENPLPVLENETYTLKHTLSNFLEKPLKTALMRLVSMYVCFKTPLPVMENETYTLKHKHSKVLKNHTLGGS